MTYIYLFIFQTPKHPSHTHVHVQGLSNDDIEFILSQANSTLLDIAFNGNYKKPKSHEDARPW